MAVDTGRPRACRSVEHGGLRLHKPVPDGLEVQPADVLAAAMLEAITRAFRYHQLRRDARGVNHQLLLAATIAPTARQPSSTEDARSSLRWAITNNKRVRAAVQVVKEGGENNLHYHTNTDINSTWR